MPIVCGPEGIERKAEQLRIDNNLMDRRTFMVSRVLFLGEVLDLAGGGAF